jgi:hypothetical protein
MGIEFVHAERVEAMVFARAQSARRRRQVTVTDLLEHDWFELWYQPKVEQRPA